MDLVLLKSDTYGTRIPSVISSRTTWWTRPLLFDWIMGMFEKLSSPEFFLIIRGMDYSKLLLILEKFGADW